MLEPELKLISRLNRVPKLPKFPKISIFLKPLALRLLELRVAQLLALWVGGFCEFHISERSEYPVQLSERAASEQGHSVFVDISHF